MYDIILLMSSEARKVRGIKTNGILLMSGKYSEVPNILSDTSEFVISTLGVHLYDEIFTRQKLFVINSWKKIKKIIINYSPMACKNT